MTLCREHFSIILLMIVMSALMCVKVTPKLVWNVSASAPIGLYALQSVDVVRRHDLVALSPSANQTAFLEERHALAKGALLLKHVVALTGQSVCRRGTHILIDGTYVARAQIHDRQGRRLPVWQGCHKLTDTELFVLNDVSDSLDSRYLGPFSKSSLVGLATALWIEN